MSQPTLNEQLEVRRDSRKTALGVGSSAVTPRSVVWCQVQATMVTAQPERWHSLATYRGVADVPQVTQ